MKRLIVYDLDGTLVDTLTDLSRAANEMLCHFKQEPLSPQSIRQFVGSGVHQLVARCLNTQEVQRVHEGVRVFRRFYEAHLLDESRLYPGVEEVLAYFQSRKQVVVTNKPTAYAKTILAGLRVAQYFADIVGADSGFPIKPDPTLIKTLIERFDEVPEETLLIGDSPIDIETGRQAGVWTVAVSQGFSDEATLREASPQAMVSDFPALLAMAKKINW